VSSRRFCLTGTDVVTFTGLASGDPPRHDCVSNRDSGTRGGGGGGQLGGGARGGKAPVRSLERPGRV